MEKSERPSNLEKKEGIWEDNKKAIWISNDAEELQLRLCVIAQNGPVGHHGQPATEQLQRESYF